MKKNSLKIRKAKRITPAKKEETLWNPFETFGDSNRLFLNDPWTSPWLQHFGWRRPWEGVYLGQDIKEVPLDIIDTGKQFKIVAEMPGIQKQDLEVTLTDKNISICGKMETETTIKNEEYLHKERGYSTLCRNLVFPTEVNPDSADASLKDGILEIFVTKKTQKQTTRRTIPIK